MALKTLNLYIIRRILSPFFLGLTVLFVVLSLERLLRLVDIVTANNAPSYKILEFLFYLMPHYLGLALPAALFLGIILAVRRLLEDSELAILQSTGLSLRYLYKPAAIIVIPATALILILTGFAQPHARYAYRLNLHELAIEKPLSGLRPGIFLEITPGNVIRVENIRKEDGVMEGVFIANVKENSGEKIIIRAQQARIIRDEETQTPVLRLENGNLIRDLETKRQISKLSFATYPWKLPGLINEAYGRRGQDEREMSLIELASGGVKSVESQSTPRKMITEFHVRILQALTLPLLALWAIPLALLGGGRAGKASGIIIGAGLLVLYEKLLGLGQAYAAHGDMPIWLALWVPFTIFGLSGWLFMRHKIPETLQIKEAKP